MAVAAVSTQHSFSTGRRNVMPVRAWLYVLAGLIGLMIAIGGATRLTGSGLSITEWRPITGAVPPLTEPAWSDEFVRYQGSSQYQNLNRGMTLPEFKFIYWWEWSHRQLGRLIGIVFFLPLIWFWFTGSVGLRLTAGLFGIGCLGALQGAIGWIMVASGLEPGMIAVAPIKLTLHLVTASALLGLVVWTAAGLRDDTRSWALPSRGAVRASRTAFWLLGLIGLQIALGGLVAGSRAGLTYNTWPLMDGRIVPPADVLFTVRPWYENWIDSPALVQFDHRGVAYLIVVLALFQLVRLWRASPGSSAARRAAVIAGLALTQMLLGIVTLLLVVPLWAGLAHQLLAMALLSAATIHARLSSLGESSRSLTDRGQAAAGS